MADETKDQTKPAETAGQAAGDGKKELAPMTLRAVLGEKLGMTQLFNKDGERKPVTIVKAGPCSVVRVKSHDGSDGYSAVVLGYGREKHPRKAEAGQFKPAQVEPMRHLKEFRVRDADVKGFKPGQVVSLVGRFHPGDYVDVQGTSKGKGFAGVMKRHGFGGLPASHGASDKERSPGALASRRSLGRVLPGQRMAGHMGVDTVTVQKVEVLRVRWNENLLYLGGAVPGPRGGLVTVLETVKALKRRPIRAKVKQVRKDKMGNIIVEQVRTKKKKV
jgi:large subunit ribosomal protein L3